MKPVKIETLIENFEFAIKEYSKAVKELPKQKDEFYYLRINEMHFGLCWFLRCTKKVNFHLIFINGYYSKISIENGYIFPIGKKGLKPRINWMKTEVKELKRLIKKGYTHV